MLSVVEGYRRDGLFDRYRVRLISTHQEGGIARRLLFALSALLRLTGLLASGGVVLVHSHMAMRGSFWRKLVLNRLSRLFGVPVIGHLHGSEFVEFYSSQPQWRKKLIRDELEACSRVVVLSKVWADFVVTVAPRARVVEIPNYVTLSCHVGRERHESGEIVLLFLGLIGERKGVFDLLCAFASARQRVDTLRLRVGGNGDVERARRIASELGIEDHVEFLGWVSGDNKTRLFREADIFVLPSYSENFPVSILEAMSHGIPVISTKAGGIPEMLRDDVEGVLIDAGAIPALSDAIVRLASDDKLRNRLGVAGHDRVASLYSRDVVLSRLEGVYDDVLNVGRSPVG